MARPNNRKAEAIARELKQALQRAAVPAQHASTYLREHNRGNDDVFVVLLGIMAAQMQLQVLSVQYQLAKDGKL